MDSGQVGFQIQLVVVGFGFTDSDSLLPSGWVGLWIQYKYLSDLDLGLDSLILSNPNPNP